MKLASIIMVLAMCCIYCNLLISVFPQVSVEGPPLQSSLQHSEQAGSGPGWKHLCQWQGQLESRHCLSVQS